MHLSFVSESILFYFYSKVCNKCIFYHAHVLPHVVKIKSHSRYVFYRSLTLCFCIHLLLHETKQE